MLGAGDPAQHRLVGDAPRVAAGAAARLLAADAQRAHLHVVIDVPHPGNMRAPADHLRRQIAAHAVVRGAFARRDRDVACTCASAEMLSTSRLNTPTGGPSIDSNAMVGPEAPDGQRDIRRGGLGAAGRACGKERGDNAAADKARMRASKSPDHPDTTPRSGAGGHAAKVPERRRLHRLGSAKAAPGPVALFHQCNRIDVTAVIRLAAMGGTAVAEEARRLRIGAQPEVLDAWMSARSSRALM